MKRALGHMFSVLLIALTGLVGCMSETTKAEEFKVGTDYTIIDPPLETQAPAGKVEVTELFWYGCPHCYHLEPTIAGYIKKIKNKSEPVFFQRMPAMLSPRWDFHAKLFYVGQMLDPTGEKNLHTKIFDALQKQGRRIDNDDAMVLFFKDQGFSADKIQSVMTSMELNAMLARADDFGKKSGADSVPTIIINGKYMTSPSMVGSADKLIDVIDSLVKRETK